MKIQYTYTYIDSLIDLHTLQCTAWIWIWMIIRRGAISDNGFILKKKMKINREKRKKDPVGGFWNNPTYPLLSTWKEPLPLYEQISLRTILKHFKWSHSVQKNSNYMHGLKSAILAIFQKLANWLDWPCPVSAAAHRILFCLCYILILIYFFEYETIVRSSATSAGHSDPDPSSVFKW